MASVRELSPTNRGEERFQAQVRRGEHALSRTFDTEKDANRWAKDVEAALRIDSPTTRFNPEDWLLKTKAKKAAGQLWLGNASPDPTPHWTMARALDFYGETVSPTKQCEPQELSRIRFLKESLGHILLGRLTATDVQRHVDARKKAGKGAATIRLEVMQLRALWKHARMVKPHGWGLDLGLVHPCAALKLGALPPPRKRRLQDEDQEMGITGEERALRAALGAGLDGEDMVDLFDLALETGMRRGELLGITRAEVSHAGRLWRIEKLHHKGEQHGHERTVILSARAIDIVRRRMKGLVGEDRLFSLNGQDARTRFRKACRLAGVRGLRFHDLRHEGISRFAEAGMSLGELKAQSGHKTTAMLGRYVNARESEIARKLG